MTKLEEIEFENGIEDFFDALFKAREEEKISFEQILNVFPKEVVERNSSQKLDTARS